MPLFGRDRGRIEADRTQALAHPMRLRILELFTRNTDRPLAADSLAADLIADFPTVRIRQVAYHLAVLQDAKLIPAG
jgi:Fe2+ or Zn2+ uptake regulation protein